MNRLRLQSKPVLKHWVLGSSFILGTTPQLSGFVCTPSYDKCIQKLSTDTTCQTQIQAGQRKSNVKSTEAFQYQASMLSCHCEIFIRNYRIWARSRSPNVVKKKVGVLQHNQKGLQTYTYIHTHTSILIIWSDIVPKNTKFMKTESLSWRKYRVRPS